MTVPRAVRGWVADAEAAHGASFESWFPSSFDWRALAADVPRIAEGLGERWKAETAAAVRARLEETAVAAFRGAYVATLALLAGYDADRDPDAALERLVAPLADEEEEAFEASLEADLGAAEEAVARAAAGEGGAAPRPSAGPRATGPKGVESVARIAALVGDVVREILSEGLHAAARAVVSLGGGAEPSARVLSGVVNVAIAVAALRYGAAQEADRARGEPPLSWDDAALEAALAGGGDA